MSVAIQPVLTNRQSPLSFNAAPVSADDRAALLEAARWAPSSFNEQPWRIVYGDLHENADDHDRIAQLLVPGNRRWAQAAPLLMVTCAATTMARTGDKNAHAWHDMGAAMAQLAIEATARGLVIHQMGGIDRTAARAALRVPDGFDVVAGVAVGHPGEISALEPDLAARQQLPRTRKPASELFFAGRFSA